MCPTEAVLLVARFKSLFKTSSISMDQVTRVAFFDDGVYSHSYPSSVFGPLKDHWLQDGWIVSQQCPSTVCVTTLDRDGLQRVWKGRSGDVFISDNAIPVNS